MMRGVEIHTHTEVTGILVENGRLKGVETNHGTVYCNKAMQAAAQAHASESPRFGSRAECIRQYGDNCVEHAQQHGMWMPLLTGFMLSQLLHGGRAPTYMGANPVYRTPDGRYNEWSRNGSRAVDVAPNRAVTV